MFESFSEYLYFHTLYTVHSINELTLSENLTNSAITFYLEDMLGFFRDIMFQHVKIIQENKTFLSKWYNFVLQK